MVNFAPKLGDLSVAGFANCAVGLPVLALDQGSRDRIATPVNSGDRDYVRRRVGKAR